MSRTFVADQIQEKGDDRRKHKDHSHIDGWGQHGPESPICDQRSQFTSDLYVSLLQREGILIRMDGKGRAIDNIFVESLWRSVKYENIYLYAYEDGLSLYKGLYGYFEFYNHERLYKSLDYATRGSHYLKNDAQLWCYLI